MIRDPSDGSTKSAPGADTYTALKAKHGETWGIKQPERLPKAPFKAPTAQQLAEHYATHNLAFEPKAEEGK